VKTTTTGARRRAGNERQVTALVLPLCCYGKVQVSWQKTLDSQKKHEITKSNLHTVKMPRKCVAVSTIHRPCATHCKPETKQTGDCSNACACLYRSL